MTNTNPPNDAPLDPDEPFIDGNPPRTAKDYVRDSKPDPQTVDDGLTESPGGGVSGEGWTAHGPG